VVKPFNKICEHKTFTCYFARELAVDQRAAVVRTGFASMPLSRCNDIKRAWARSDVDHAKGFHKFALTRMTLREIFHGLYALPDEDRRRVWDAFVAQHRRSTLRGFVAPYRRRSIAARTGANA
jgi:hypothetical protein